MCYFSSKSVVGMELSMRRYLVIFYLHKCDFTFFLENKMLVDLTFYQENKDLVRTRYENEEIPLKPYLFGETVKYSV